MKIKIIAVGKIKEKYLVEGIKEYSKRLSRYTKLEIIEVSDEKCPENISLKDQELVMQKEAERILNIIDYEYVIALAIEGEELGSESLSEKIKSIMTYSNSSICFVIGGSLG
jgi:23S rRNA (pseudouridine1915-N3)-methyltransferase